MTNRPVFLFAPSLSAMSVALFNLVGAQKGVTMRLADDISEEERAFHDAPLSNPYFQQYLLTRFIVANNNWSALRLEIEALDQRWNELRAVVCPPPPAGQD